MDTTHLAKHQIKSSVDWYYVSRYGIQHYFEQNCAVDCAFLLILWSLEEFL